MTISSLVRLWLHRDPKPITEGNGKAKLISQTLSIDHIERVSALLSQRRYPAALVLLEPLLTSFAGNWQLQAAWAQAQQGVGEFDEAARAWCRAIELKPDLAMAAGNLALLEFSRARFGEAHSWIAKACDIEGLDSSYHHTRLGFLNYDPAFSQAEIQAAHEAWGRAVEAQFAVPANLRSQRGHDRLRIGYVSADFCNHSTYYFIVQLLHHHDPTQFEIFNYYNRTEHDAATQQLASMVEHWRDIAALTDQQVAEQIITDEIDVLVDLSGHTVGNRLKVFARRVAPVQVTWLGYPQTTGLSRIDYRISDAILDPVDERPASGGERLYRLAESMICFAPPTGITPQLDTCRTDQPLVFAAVSAYCKVSDACIRAWTAALAACSGTTLVCFHQHGRFPHVREDVLARFRDYGADSSRIEIRPWLSPQEFIAQLADIDLVLDTFPYGGGTTSNLCLWAGVPFVTLCGDTPPSRCGAMILNRVGLDEFVANDEVEFCAICADLAHEPKLLRSRRKQIAAAYRKSPICDYEGFTRRVEAGFVDMWQRSTAVEEVSSTPISTHTDELTIRHNNTLPVVSPIDSHISESGKPPGSLP